MYIVLLTIAIHKTAGVRLVMLRPNANSASEEDRSESLSEEESEEIDLLLDLIENESKHRKASPMTTVRLIKQVAEHSEPQVERVQQRGMTKERIQYHPNSFREYHVHYHNHHHKGPVKPPAVSLQDMHPYAWGSHFPLNDFDAFRQMPQKSPLLPYPETAKVNNFKEIDSFLKTHPRSRFPHSENVDPRYRLEAIKDYETLIKPRIPSYKVKMSPPFERIKKFQEFYDSEEEKTTVSNKDRFAGFKDFSELEDSDNPDKPEHPKSEERPILENLDKKTVKIKDFAIVIKTRPRKNHNKENDIENNDDQDESTGPQIPPFVNRLNVPYDRLFGMPRVIDSAGGSPKYIDALNQLKYPPHERFNMPMPYPPLKGPENDPRQFHPMRAPFLPQAPPPPGPPVPPHYPMHPVPHHPLRNVFNNWFPRRFLR